MIGAYWDLTEHSSALKTLENEIHRNLFGSRDHVPSMTHLIQAREGGDITTITGLQSMHTPRRSDLINRCHSLVESFVCAAVVPLLLDKEFFVKHWPSLRAWASHNQSSLLMVSRPQMATVELCSKLA